MDAINWNEAARRPDALVLLPWENGGTTICKRQGAQLFGCRDVEAGPDHDSIVHAWIVDAGNNGMVTEDRRPHAFPLDGHDKPATFYKRGDVVWYLKRSGEQCRAEVLGACVGNELLIRNEHGIQRQICAEYVRKNPADLPADLPRLDTTQSRANKGDYPPDAWLMGATRADVIAGVHPIEATARAVRHWREQRRLEALYNEQKRRGA